METPETPGRLDSRLEQEGAEFLVLGQLLIEGIEAHKAYTRYPGFDIVALRPETARQCRIQVKSRWATDHNRRFPMRTFDCDFVVFVSLNRGYRSRGNLRRYGSPPGGRKDPDFFVFPVEAVKQARVASSSWGNVAVNAIPAWESCRDAWEQIARFLDTPELLAGVLCSRSS